MAVLYPNTPPQYQPHHKGALSQYLTSYKWEAWFTGSGEPNAPFETLDNLFGRWRSRLAHRSGLQVGSIGVFTTDPVPHIHALLVGTNKHGQTMADLSSSLREELEFAWERMAHRPGRIALIAHPEAVTTYVVNGNTVAKPSRFLSPRGIKTLKRFKIN